VANSVIQNSARVLRKDVTLENMTIAGNSSYLAQIADSAINAYTIINAIPFSATSGTVDGYIGIQLCANNHVRIFNYSSNARTLTGLVLKVTYTA